MKNIYLKFLLSALLIIIAYSTSYAQLPSTLWAKAYNGPANLQDSSVSVSVNANGEVFVTGWSLGATTAEDIVTIKYNPNSGDTIWVKRLAGPLQDKPTSMTSDNNAVYVTGWTFGATRDIITIKYNAATGDTTWVKRFNGSNNGGDYGLAITSDAAGNVYVAGRSDVTGGAGQKFTILKYDASGNVPSGWPVVYTGPLSTAFDEAHAVKVDGAGNVYVTGQGGATGSDDFLTMKINSAGIVQWAKKYNGTLNQEDNAVALSLDNTAANIFVGGYGFIAGHQQDYIVIKYSSNGDSLGFVSYNGPIGQIEILTAMAVDASNNVYITGYSTGSGTGYDYATLKYNSSLAQQWVARTTDGGSDFPFSIAVGDTNSVYVTGSSIGSGTAYDYLTIKYRSDGSESWRKRENGSASSNDYASHVAFYDVDHVYVTGSANFNSIGIAYYTIRYSNVLGIEQISTQIPQNFTLSQNFPNPFNPTTTIKFDIPKQTFVKVAVYDVMGREVEILGNEMVKAGQYKVTWDASKYSSGIYFYKLITENYSETKKMILVK